MEPHPGESVVLLDSLCRPVGWMPKNDVHTRQTPFHLALSCYLFDLRGRILITQRALSKKTWPGVVTNSACGHPRVNESLERAARRVVRHELGCDIAKFKTLLPDFSYRAVSDRGIVEWEYCPVVAAVVDSDDIALNSDEAEGALWLDWRSFVGIVDSAAIELSPWSRLQVKALKELGPPAGWCDRSDELPDFLRCPDAGEPPNSTGSTEALTQPTQAFQKTSFGIGDDSSAHRRYHHE
ncbi:isopentenyl-diphosphate Delta-isomerase [Mycobacterium sp. SP-6446]|uniref:isopentenyl-diphosphate Delta-isomerase n=1 Tax=Mycobacterium sp. SP-6446 TaxID=1834162 RepID=UPI00096CFE83|nr:isopentenyl-diphosphate Delta-isomerase [Mycobacterium sp. SP-6446]OMC13525.1 isopentenyl-diphosphate delta-isomerase [Mycobacterium sp. SP-6446]